MLINVLRRLLFGLFGWPLSPTRPQLPNPGDSVLRCTLCEARFLGVKGLGWHIQAAHPRDDFGGVVPTHKEL